MPENVEPKRVYNKKEFDAAVKQAKQGEVIFYDGRGEALGIDKLPENVEPKCPKDCVQFERREDSDRIGIKIGAWDYSRNSELPTFRVYAIIYVEREAFEKEARWLLEINDERERGLRKKGGDEKMNLTCVRCNEPIQGKAKWLFDTHTKFGERIGMPFHEKCRMECLRKEKLLNQRKGGGVE